MAGRHAPDTRHSPVRNLLVAADHHAAAAHGAASWLSRAVPVDGDMCGLYGCGVGVLTPGHGTNGVAMTMKGAIYPRNGRNFG